MGSAQEIVETQSTVRAVGLSESMRVRLELALAHEDYSPQQMRDTFTDIELVNVGASVLGWDCILNMFEAEAHA